MRLILLLGLAFSTPVFSWDGYDQESGAEIEIGKGNTVRRGREIEFYDYNDHQYKTGEVQSIRRSGRTVEVEIEDSSTGDIRTFDMEGR